MRIVHIASFAGNIGDIINHLGFYNAMNINEQDVNKIEIRKFYRNQGKNRRVFDKKLADEINQYDLLVLGGGGFFDVYFDESETGTTFDMSEQFVNSITIPVVVNAMGVHIDRLKTIAVEKFGQFIGLISKKDNWYISIRNDGSYKRMVEVLGKDSLVNIHVVPDNGFVFKNNKQLRLDSERKVIGLNITNEIIDPEFTNGITTDSFNKKIAKLVMQIINKDNICCFFVHTPQDIETLNKIMNICGREHFRDNVVLAPYMPFFSCLATKFANYYAYCDLVIGMRFHANVLAMAVGIPVVGLAIHEQISGLYKEIGLNEHFIRIGEKAWINKLKVKIFSLLKNNRRYQEEQEAVKKMIVTQHQKYILQLKKFFAKAIMKSNRRFNK